jgi:glucose/arabinose dehydrogenase
MKTRLSLLLAALCALVALVASPAGSAGVAERPAATASAAERPGGNVRLKRIGNFDQPVHIASAPGFPRLVFVVEQRGRIKVIRRGRKLRRSFLDITNLVQYGGEEGLLSLAFPPNYKRSKRFYVYYTDNNGDIRVEEFRRRSAVRAARTTRRVVIRIGHPVNSNHNGGQLQFLGKLLYIATGDGGSGGDPPDNAKSRRTLLGKILRINPRNPRGRANFTVPRGNPFVGRRGRDAIFAYGLRNPFRFSFHKPRGKTPRIAIGDVGQERFEEVDYETIRGARGANFGWDEWEGFAPFECDGQCTRGTAKPIYAYGGGCSVIGGYVVRDRRLGNLAGRYVFADLCEGKIRSIPLSLRGRVRRAPPTGMRISTPSSFGEDRRGRVYVASLDGPVYRLVRG